MPSHETPSEKKIESIQKALHGYSKKKTKWDEKGAPEKSTKQPTVRQTKIKNNNGENAITKLRDIRELYYTYYIFCFNNFFLT